MGVASHDAVKQFEALLEEVEEPLKKTFKNVHQGYPKETLARFLRAREWNVEKAHKMLVDSLNWRIQNDIDNILTKPIVPIDLYRAVRDSQLLGVSGYSKQGLPVFAIGVGQSTFDKASVHYYVQSHIQINEYRDRVVLPNATRKYGRHIGTCVKVLDMTGLKLSALSQIKLLTVISTIDDLNYPEKTDTYYIVNVPYIFSACWKVVKPLLQERTRRKVQVLQGCGKDELLKVPLYISSVSAQIVVLPIGKFMAATLPTRPIRIPATKWSFSMNPGPFNLKEHVLITIFANSGSNTVYAVNIITIVKAFYRGSINPAAAWLLSQTTQLLGYGWAGIFRKFLVDSPYMWWPSNLVQVSLFRVLHEEEVRSKRGQTRLQFFLLVLGCSFAYYIVPNYLFPAITAISFVCYIWKDSVTAHQIGSGLYGLGVGSFAIDWATVASFLGTPLATPGFAIINVMVGFFLIVYVLLPITYWTNTYDAKRFPIFSPHVFSHDGQPYNVSLVLNRNNYTFNPLGYDDYSKVNLSVFFVFTYGISFATLAATISHVALFHGRSIWRQTKETFRNQIGDVHTRIMKKNYAQVPQWWFYVLMVFVIALSMLTCEGFGGQLQLPYWGVMLAIALALFFTLPIGVITATTNQQPGLNVITELIIGYMYPGKPFANVAFKTYGYISMSQAIMFLSDFKLGHYMKIPPKSMFVVQLVGTVISSTVYFGTAWWLLTSVQNICQPSLLPEGSPWTCPGDDVFYSASIIWGLVGPRRMFGNLGLYAKMNWFFLVGLFAPVPVWVLARMFPKQKWISLINMPILIGATGNMPPARSVNYLCWGAVGIFFNFYVYRKFKGWWAKHNYVLSAGLDAGVAFSAIVCYMALQIRDIEGVTWWGLDNDHCPLAQCPTAPGIKVEGCPTF